MAKCFKCGHELPPRERIFRTTLCEQCGGELRVCRNCVFYLPGAHWDCRETISEAVRDKERANFCEFFRTLADPGEAIPHEDVSETSRNDTARSRFNNLFSDS